MDIDYVDEEGMWRYKSVMEVLLCWGIIDLDQYVGLLLRLDERWRKGPMNKSWDHVEGDQ